jgi:hypothetical protein
MDSCFQKNWKTSIQKSELRRKRCEMEVEDEEEEEQEGELKMECLEGIVWRWRRMCQVIWMRKSRSLRMWGPLGNETLSIE